MKGNNNVNVNLEYNVLEISMRESIWNGKKVLAERTNNWVLRNTHLCVTVLLHCIEHAYNFVALDLYQKPTAFTM
jgi:hypothetical protein